MRNKPTVTWLLLSLGVLSCNNNNLGNNGGGDGGDNGLNTQQCLSTPDYGTQCWLDGVSNGENVNASCTGGTQTTLSGVVNIPAGNLPLYNAKVYIAQTPAPDDPNAPQNLPAIISGATCDTCAQVVPTDAVTSATTDATGAFKLTNVPYPPDGKAMYLVIRVGKWRRAVRIENANSTNAKATKIQHCMTTQIDPEASRLPRNKSEGNIPRIALSTGSADALECLLRSQKLGLDDAEFTNPDPSPTGGRVNLFAGGVYSADPIANTMGTSSYSASNMMFPTADPWWNDAANWNQYDIVMLSCEGAQNANIKSSAAESALQSYINAGGRVFASHWHNVWISNAPAPLSSVASFISDADPGYQNDSSAITVTVNMSPSFPKGVALANWLQLPQVGGSKMLGSLAINYSRVTLIQRDANKTQDWIDFTSKVIPFSNPSLANPASQYFSFYAPVDATPDKQCGQMVFTDIHVSGGRTDMSLPQLPFPTGCTSSGLTPQEKALIFMLFDLTNCVQPVIG